MTQPKSFDVGLPLPVRSAVQDAVAGGAQWRRDERQHLAGGLVGTYQIRLRMAQGEQANQLAELVDNLNGDPDRKVAAYILGGSNQLLCWVFEGWDDGEYLGCLTGSRAG